MRAWRRLRRAGIAAALVFSAGALSGGGCCAPDSNAIQVQNLSGEVLLRLWIWPCDSEDRGPNRLQAPVLPGASVRVEGILDGCVRIRAEGDFGGAWDREWPSLRCGSVEQWVIGSS